MKNKRCPECGERLAISCDGDGEMVQFACGTYYYIRNPDKIYFSKRCLEEQVKILKNKVERLEFAQEYNVEYS